MENPTILGFDKESAILIKVKRDGIENSDWSEVGEESIKMSHPHSHTFSAVAIGDTIFVLTWDKYVCSIKPFSKTPEWREHSYLQKGHGPEPAVAVYDGRIYVCGGGWAEATLTFPDGSTTQRLSRRCEVFNTEDENPQWQYIGKLRHMNRRISIIEVGGKIYCVGGLRKSYSATAIKVEPGAMKPEPEGGSEEPDEEFDDCAVEVQNAVEMYDPKTDSWVEKAPLKTPRVAPGLAKFEEWIFVLGGGSGNDEDGEYLNSIECYNTSANAWQDIKCEMQVARMLFMPYCTGMEIIIVGGEQPESRSIEKIKVKRIADAIVLEAGLRTTSFRGREINRMATVLMSCEEDRESIKCDT